jgi:maltooligosyltrehalose trehalohydrolase
MNSAHAQTSIETVATISHSEMADQNAPLAPIDARRLPIGAEVLRGGGAHFRVWAPRADSVAVELYTEGKPATQIPLQAEANGYFSGTVVEAGVGTCYKFRLPHGSFPDPASRFQPQGPHGPSQVVDPRYAWTDANWAGRQPSEFVLYELHLGTFTGEGTWKAAAAQLPELARIGITALEIMPIADFPGRFGWGYDGVDLFAPTRLYGSPDDVRAFVDRAHALGIMVILDVVYNHLGPDGCFLQEFSSDYFTTRYECEWGQPLNFDGENSGPVREFFVTNARYWIDEFHFDGLRLDATQQLYDASARHVLADVATAVRAAAPRRRTFIVAENEPQLARLLRPTATGGYGLDAVWNDDFHHAATVICTGKREAYYIDYRGTAQEFVSAAKRGFLFQGQVSRWQQKRRGTAALDLKPEQFVCFTQNHDQIANSLHGVRLQQQASPPLIRAITGLQFLMPSIPLLFQGQEFGASSPFLYFADHNPELGKLVAQGRRQFLRQFRTIAADDADPTLPSCCTTETFDRCKLDFAERQTHATWYALHCDLLKLRREIEPLRATAALDGAVLDERAFVLRYLTGGRGDRLLVVNFGCDLYFNPAPEPLLAPPDDCNWATVWSSESPRYGGGGTPPLETKQNWIIPGPAAFWLAPLAHRELPSAKITEKD